MYRSGFGPYPLEGGVNVFAVDENTVRLYIGSFEGTMHVRVVG
jgi:hypothetical protein